MMLCTIYILVGLAFTTTIIELVRLVKVCSGKFNFIMTDDSTLRAGGRCRS